MKHKIIKLAAIACIAFSANAMSAVISWADWQSSSTNGATGEALQDGSVVNITQENTAANAFVLLGAPGEANYWGASGSTPSGIVTAYTQGNVDNAPVTSDIIALNAAGTTTITFDRAVSDIYIGLVSWNTGASSALFNVPITVDSFGAGYWGTGTSTLNVAGNGFSSTGEFHGIVRIVGSHSSFTFSSGAENWHGFTIGFAETSPAVNDIPAPTSALLIVLGVAGLFAARKK